MIDLDNIVGLINLEVICRYFEVAENFLFICWKLVVFYIDSWNIEIDIIIKYVIYNFVKFFFIVFDFSNMEEILIQRYFKSLVV